MQRSSLVLLALALCASLACSSPAQPKGALEVRAVADARLRALVEAHKAAVEKARQEANDKKLEVEEVKPVVPELVQQQPLPHINGYNYALDVISYVSGSTFSCIYNSGFRLAFLRIYGPSNNGQVDSTGLSNIFAATGAGFAYEVFVTPSTSGVKTGRDQFTEAYNYAVQNGLKLNRVWLQVTSPVNWGLNTYSNVQFISSFINAASSSGVQVGVYTNWYDWAQITASTTSVNPSALWYWNANGLGGQAESKRDLTDFYNFGPFRSAMIKQYGIQEYYCSTYVNVNIYPNNFGVAGNSLDVETYMRAQKLQQEASN